MFVWVHGAKRVVALCAGNAINSLNTSYIVSQCQCCFDEQPHEVVPQAFPDPTGNPVLGRMQLEKG